MFHSIDEATPSSAVRRRDDRPQVLRPLGPLAPRHAPRQPVRRGADARRGRLRRLVVGLSRRQGRRHGPRPGPRHGVRRPVLGGPDAQLHLPDARGRHPAALPARPAHTSRRAPRSSCASSASASGAAGGRSSSSTSSTASSYENEMNTASYRVESPRGRLEEPRARQRLHDPAPRRLPRHPAAGPPLQPARRDLLAPRGDGRPGQVPPPRGGRPGPVRDRDADAPDGCGPPTRPCSSST